MKSSFSRSFFTAATILLLALTVLGASFQLQVNEFMEDTTVTGLQQDATIISNLAAAYSVDGSLSSRELLLKRYGIEFVRQFPVTKEVMGMPWRKFLAEMMACGAVGFVCGDDFHFGSCNEGNVQVLKEFCGQRGMPCIVVPEQSVGGKRISSTYIRRQIESGDMETAMRFLGHPHIISGVVIPGRQLGRTLGIPTANILLEPGLVVPRFGVYACRCLVDGKEYAAVTNVGTRPTVSGEGVTVEPWLLNYEGNLYGREITLEFCRFLRPETKFESLEALKNQIHRDARTTREYFGL